MSSSIRAAVSAGSISGVRDIICDSDSGNKVYRHTEPYGNYREKTGSPRASSPGPTADHSHRVGADPLQTMGADPLQTMGGPFGVRKTICG